VDNTSKPSKPLPTFLFWLVVHGLVITALVTVFIGVVPVFDKMFMEFGIKLPLLTVLLFNSSRFLTRYGLVLIPTGVLGDFGMLCLLTLAVGMPSWLRSLWCYGVLVTAGVLFLLVVVGILLPYLRLIQGLS
jgi:hypothetical protein